MGTGSILNRTFITSLQEISKPPYICLNLFERPEIAHVRACESQTDTIAITPNLAASEIHESWW